jgi:TP901 family phage tail tape measure protein
MASDDGSIDLDFVAQDSGVEKLVGGTTSLVKDLVAAFDVAQRRFASAVTEVQKLNAEMKVTATTAATVGKAVGSIADAAKKSTDAASKLQDVVAEAKMQRAATTAGYARAGRTQLPDGRTIADAQSADQLVRGLITGIDTTTKQIEARLAIATTRAAQRLIQTMEGAMAAELNKAQVGAASLIAKYGTPEAANLQMRASVIAQQRLASRIGGAQSYDDILQVEAARSLERQRSAALQKQVIDETRARESAEASLERQRSAALQKQVVDEARERESAEASLARQRNAAMQKRLTEEYRLENDNVARIAAEKRARLDSNYKGKSLDQIEEEAAAVAAVKAAQRAELREQARAQRQITGAQGGIQSTLTGMLAAGVALSGAAEITHSVVDLDDAMTRFQAITGAANGTMDEFHARLTMMAAGTRFATSELAEVSTTLAQTGLSARDVLQTLPNVINLATASGSTLRQSVEVLTSVLGAYNLEASKTGDIANVMTGALNKTRLTIEQLSFGLQYSSDIASQMGISVTELTAVFGGLAQAGVRSGSVMGTAVRQIIREFSNPTTKLKEELHNLGISMGEVDIKTNGLMGVMDNLKAHGFGTAEAMRSLEARSVTSFAALMIQSNNIKRLNEELLLYNGAVDGAAKANESLVARMTQLGNSVLAVSDRALSPMMAMLKGTASGLSSMLGAALRLGNVLPVIGAGLTGIAVALTTITALKLGSTMYAAATALGVLSGPVGWIGLAAGAVAASTGLFLTFGNGAASAADRIDRLKGSIQDLDSCIKQSTTSSQEIDKSIDEILTKRDRLNNDPLLRRNTIIEAQKQFGDLGLTIKANATNIDDLVEALRKLRGELAQGTPELIDQRLIETGKLIDELRHRAAPDARSTMMDLARANGLPEDGYLASHGWLPQGRQADAMRRGYVRQFGTDFGPLFDTVANYDKLPEDDVRSVTNSGFGLIRQRAEALRNERAGASPARQAEIEDLLSRLDAFSAALQHAQDYVSNIQSATRTQERLGIEGRVAQVQASPLYQRLGGAGEDVKRSFTSDIEKAQRGGGPEAQAAGLEAAKVRAAEQLAKIRAQITTEMEELEQHGVRSEVVEQSYGALLAKLQGLDAVAADKLVTANKALEAIKKPTLELQKSTLSQQIKETQDGLKSALSPAEIDAAQVKVNNYLDQIAAVEKQLVDLAAAASGDDSESKSKKAEIDAATLARKREEAEKAESEKRSMAEKVLTMQERATAARRKEIDAQISALDKELNSPQTSSDKIQSLREKLDQLIDQRLKMVEDAANTKYQRDLLTTPQGYAPTAAAAPGSVQRQIIDAATAGGRSDLSEFLLHLAQHESGFDPNKPNAQGSGAYGLFQFMPKTWDARGKSVEEQVAEALRYDADVQKQFMDKMGRAPNDQEHYALWQQGAGGTTALLQNPNATAVAALTGAYGGDAGKAREAVRQNLPTSMQDQTDKLTAKEFFDLTTADFRGGAGKAPNKYVQSTTDVLADERDAAIREQREADRAAREEQDRKDADRQYKDLKSSAALSNLSDDARITQLTDSARDEMSPMSNTLANLRMAADLRRQRAGNAVDLVNADPNGDADDKAVTMAQTKVEYTAKYVTELQNAAKIIEANSAAADKAELRRAEALQKTLTESGKATPAEVLQGAREVENLKRAEGLDELRGKEQALKFLEDQINAARKDANLDQAGLNGLTEKETELRREIAELQAKQHQTEELRARPDSFGAGINSGTLNFFQSSGALDKNGQWKSSTQQIAGIWQETMGVMENSMTSFFDKWASGTLRGKQAMRQFEISIIQSMENIAAKALSEQLMKGIFGSLFSIGGGGAGGSSPGLLGGIMGLFGSKALGGYVKAATGLYNPNRDSVPVLAQPGEMILRQSAVQMIGRDGLESLNTMGNKRISSSAPAAMPAIKSGESPVVNLWVAHPDQIPPPGPKDIVHHVASDIMQGGQMKTLIKQVQLGTI